MTQAIAHDILARHRPMDFGPTLLSDFTLDAGRPVPVQTLLDPTWSLYGLDMAAGQALFVDLPPGLDLSTATFLPILQSTQALRLIRLPLEDLPTVAALMPQPDQVILMFSMGRCGSTLASQLLAQVPGVLSLSEPEAFMTLALNRFKMTTDQAARLIPALTRLMFRPRTPADRVLALKFQSQVLFQAEHFFAAFPDATYVFQYRDAASWANSMSRFIQMMDTPMVLQGEDLTRSWMMMTASAPLSDLAALFDLSQPQPCEHLLAPAWARHMQKYLDLRAAGNLMFPLRYSALNSDPHTSAASLLTHCGLTVPDLTQALAVFGRDSQEGTQIARNATIQGFTGKNFTRFATTLARVAPTLDPDMILPR